MDSILSYLSAGMHYVKPSVTGHPEKDALLRTYEEQPALYLSYLRGTKGTPII